MGEHRGLNSLAILLGLGFRVLDSLQLVSYIV